MPQSFKPPRRPCAPSSSPTNSRRTSWKTCGRTGTPSPPAMPPSTAAIRRAWKARPPSRPCSPKPAKSSLAWTPPSSTNTAPTPPRSPPGKAHRAWSGRTGRRRRRERCRRQWAELGTKPGQNQSHFPKHKTRRGRPAAAPYEAITGPWTKFQPVPLNHWMASCRVGLR